MAGLHGPYAAVQGFRFNAPELGFAALVEDGGNSTALLPLDLFVQVEKIPAEFVCQGSSDSGLAASHEADQVDAGCAFELENHGGEIETAQRNHAPSAASRESDNSNMHEGLLPLFPLQVVLFPGGELPLHIFEDRYKEMIGEVLRDRQEFGVVLASEKGVVNTGCTATVDKVLRRYPDGRLDILTRGRRRFEILLLNDERPFLRGAVEFFDDEGSAAAAPEILKLAVEGYNEMQHLLSEAGLPEEESSNPQLSFRLAQGVPDLALRQLLLTTRSEADRLRHLAGFFPGYLQKQRRVERVRNLAPRNGHGRSPESE
jgi:Lon protease-like protein